MFAPPQQLHLPARHIHQAQPQKPTKQSSRSRSARSMTTCTWAMGSCFSLVHSIDVSLPLPLSIPSASSSAPPPPCSLPPSVSSSRCVQPPELQTQVLETCRHPLVHWIGEVGLSPNPSKPHSVEARPKERELHFLPMRAAVKRKLERLRESSNYCKLLYLHVQMNGRTSFESHKHPFKLGLLASGRPSSPQDHPRSNGRPLQITARPTDHQKLGLRADQLFLADGPPPPAQLQYGRLLLEAVSCCLSQGPLRMAAVAYRSLFNALLHNRRLLPKALDPVSQIPPARRKGRHCQAKLQSPVHVCRKL